MNISRHRTVSFAGLAAIGAAIALSVLGVVSIAGCSSLGLQPAKSLDQQIAYADGVSAAALTALASAVADKSVSYAQGENLNAQIVHANQLLDAARSFEATNAGQAQTSLTTALAALNAVQAILQSAAQPGSSP